MTPEQIAILKERIQKKEESEAEASGEAERRRKRG